MKVRDIKIENYDYPLQEEKIALHPLVNRDGCKLLVSNASGRISHKKFSELPLLLKPETLIVANETKVIRARMDFYKSSGARIEIFLLEPKSPEDYVLNFASTGSCSWICLVGNKKKWKEGALYKELTLGGEVICLHAELGKTQDENGVEIKFSWNAPRFSFAEIVESAGEIPIPPYLKRKSEVSDTTDYQTVYSRTEGSVAAPTAGLHFTPELISRLKRAGDNFVTVTLHVGAGTFQPVKSDIIGDHKMHTEWISITLETLSALIDAMENGRDILAVGTTTVRTLESLPYIGVQLENGVESPVVSQWMPYDEKYRDIDVLYSLKSLQSYMRTNGLRAFESVTSIMIAPGFRWKIVNRLITNFHQPKSTLLLLVSSFLGTNNCGGERWRDVYIEALNNDYRFLSYGDACLFSRGQQPVILPLSKSMLLRAATIDAVRHINSEEDKCLVGFNHGLSRDSTLFLKALESVCESASNNDSTPVTVYLGEGAAPYRFLLAFAASLPGSYVDFNCDGGLKKRPVLPLIDALKSIGADIEYDDSPDNWKLVVRGKKLTGQKVLVDNSKSSQFLSALMLASPLWALPPVFDLTIQDMVSKPYVKMTEKMMQQDCPSVEPDWSAAAFFYEYVFVSGKEMCIDKLTVPSESLQGDAACCDIYGALGVNTLFNKDGGAVLKFDALKFDQLREEERKIELELKDFPDLVPSLVTALCYRGIPFRFTGLKHLQNKESNRLLVLHRLLMQLGYNVDSGDDFIDFNGEFHPLEEFPVYVDSYNDHRIAMAFYPLELLGLVHVENKNVVEKSFPDFYQQF